MTLGFAKNLGLIFRSINIDVQKIDDRHQQIHSMVLAGFLLQNSQKRDWFFEKTFLLANTSIEVVLEMPFLSLSNPDWEFDIKKFI